MAATSLLASSRALMPQAGPSGAPAVGAPAEPISTAIGRGPFVLTGFAVSPAGKMPLVNVPGHPASSAGVYIEGAYLGRSYMTGSCGFSALAVDYTGR
eukprot:7380339-Prymnesium_polylepis.1